MTDYTNGHAFSEVSTDSDCRNGCGWWWHESDEVVVHYDYNCDGPHFNEPPICPNYPTEEDDYDYSNLETETHVVDGKVWEWPTGEFEELVGK